MNEKVLKGLAVLGLLGIVLLYPFMDCGQAMELTTVRVTVGQRGNWDTTMAFLTGEKEGFFAKEGIKLDIFYTKGGAETLQPVSTGNADFGWANGTFGVLGAYEKGEKIKIVSASFTGVDLFWYVKADSPIKSLKDATDKNTIAYSTNGSSTNNIVVAFVQELGVKAKPTATGGPPGTLTAVMSGQVDIGWAAPPFGLQEIKDGKIRIVARGSDIPSLKGQTVRTLIVNLNSLKTKHDAIVRFMAAYREGVDWMYSDPKAVEMYSVKIKRPVALLKESMDKFQPKSALQTDEFKDLAGANADAVKLKFLDKPLTKEQLAELIQIPPRKK